MRLAVVLVLVFALAGCARTARLYPTNEIASASGVLTMNFMSYGTGHGSVELVMPDGEVLKGEYSLVRGGSASFGNVIAAVNGSVMSPAGTAFGSAHGTATMMSRSIPGGSPGVVSAFGNRGTSLHCEVLNDNFSGHGYGGCQSSTGALYRVQY